MNPVAFLKRWSTAIAVAATAFSVSYLTHAVKQAEINALRDEKAELKQEYMKQQERLSTRISDSLQANFTDFQTKLDNVGKINHEAMQKILNQYKDFGDCHNPDGIGLLNKQIRNRYAKDSDSKSAAKH